MYNKVLILSDSFKNSISSKEIGEIGKNVLNNIFPNLNVEVYRIADGGEGTVEFFLNELKFQKIETQTVNAFSEVITTCYGVKNETAVFDVASCVGFSVNDHLDLWHASTYGIGLVLKEIISKGYKKVYLGLGGSITNDGGIGILGALGAKFYNDMVAVIPFDDHSVEFNKIDLSEVYELTKNVEIIGLCDVNNPLLGPFGATYVYGKQKGGDIETLNCLEVWMTNYAKCFDVDPTIPGCGAAGGIGFALNVLSAKLMSGIKVMLDELDIKSKLDSNALLITGEGALDNTSFSGKVIGYLLELTKKYNASCLIICGINNYQGNLDVPVYPLHLGPVSNYQETVYFDVEKTFIKILKDNVYNFSKIELKQYDKLPTDIKKLRIDVFVKEQEIDENLEFDDFEDQATHYGLYTDNLLVGTCRLINLDDDTVKIGRVVVRKEFRKYGFGKILIYKVLELIKDKKVLVHAQTRSQGFYEKCGFKACGEVFIEDGIPHLQMILK